MSERHIAATVFTADYTGEPGRREFFLQARTAQDRYTFACEKQQVIALAERLAEVLLLADAEDPVKGATPARDPGLELVPEMPSARAGAIALGYEEGADSITVVIEAAEAGGPDEAEEAGALEETPETLTVVLRSDQARAFVLHALAIAGEGRELCKLCGLPMDPAGHRCPASNGHHAPA